MIKTNDVIQHILAIANQNKEWLNMIQLNNILFDCMDFLKSDVLLTRDFYNHSFENNQTKNFIIPLIFNQYRFYVAMPIIDAGKINDELNSAELNQFITNKIQANTIQKDSLSYNDYLKKKFNKIDYHRLVELTKLMHLKMLTNYRHTIITNDIIGMELGLILAETSELQTNRFKINYPKLIPVVLQESIQKYAQIDLEKRNID